MSSAAEKRAVAKQRELDRVCERCKQPNPYGNAHKCPHGNQCRHRADWKSPECEQCCHFMRRHIPLYKQKHYDTLPRCEHGRALRDHAGHVLTCPEGCVLP